MIFAENDYLSWYLDRTQREDGSINLHASGVFPLAPADLRLPDVDPRSAVAALESALACWLGVRPDEVIFTPGATGGTLLALLGLARPGDVIVAESPMYEPMIRQAARLNTPRRIRRSPRDGFALPLAEAETAIGPGTAIVMITEPHNPSGALSPREDVMAIARMAARHGAIVLVNEVYRGFADRPSFHGAADNILVVSSLSKLCGAYWPRVGWISGPAEIIRKLRMAHMNMGMPSSPAAAVGLAVVEKADALRNAAREAAAAGVAAVDAWVSGTRGLSWRRPDGPGFGCISLPDGVDDMALAEHLHDREKVLLVPGTCFESPGTVRLSWLQSGGRLAEGLSRMGRVLEDWPSIAAGIRANDSTGPSSRRDKRIS